MATPAVLPIVALIEAITAAYTGTPVRPADFSSRMISRSLVEVAVERGYVASDNGTVTVYGVDLPPIHSGINCQTFKGDGTTYQFSFANANVVNGVALGVPYVAWSNYNFILRVGGAVVPYQPVQGQTYAGYTVSDTSGGTSTALNARINLKGGSATGDGSTVAFNSGIAAAATGLVNKLGNAVLQLNVFIGGVLQAPSTYVVSTSSGQTVITFNSAPANAAAITWNLAPVSGMTVDIFAFTATSPVNPQPPQLPTAPETLLATTTAGVALKESAIQTRELMWAVVAGSTVGATNVYLRPTSG